AALRRGRFPAACALSRPADGAFPPLSVAGSDWSSKVCSCKLPFVVLLKLDPVLGFPKPAFRREPSPHVCNCESRVSTLILLLLHLRQFIRNLEGKPWDG